MPPAPYFMIYIYEKKKPLRNAYSLKWSKKNYVTILVCK